VAISHLTYIKDASGLAQAKGLPSLIYHEPAIEVKFMRWATGTTRILTIRASERVIGAAGPAGSKIAELTAAVDQQAEKRPEVQLLMSFE
jgi:hypothetical protein